MLIPLWSVHIFPPRFLTSQFPLQSLPRWNQQLCGLIQCLLNSGAVFGIIMETILSSWLGIGLIVFYYSIIQRNQGLQILVLHFINTQALWIFFFWTAKSWNRIINHHFTSDSLIELWIVLGLASQRPSCILSNEGRTLSQIPYSGNFWLFLN